MTVVEAVGDAIGAEEKNVAGLAGNGAELWIHKLLSSAEDFLEDVSSRMIAGLALVDIAFPKEPANVRVVVADLAQRVFASREVVDTAVADVAEVHPSRREPAQTESCAHAGAFIVAFTKEKDVAVDLVKKLGEYVVVTGVEANGGLPEREGKEACDFFDSDATGELTGLCATHAVAHCKCEVGGGGRGVADFPKAMDFLCVEAKAEEAVFIVGAYFSTVGVGKPMKLLSGFGFI